MAFYSLGSKFGIIGFVNLSRIKVDLSYKRVNNKRNPPALNISQIQYSPFPSSPALNYDCDIPSFPNRMILLN